MNDEQRRGFERGIAAFNRGEYFEAHEIWESVWLAAEGPLREFLQGLIQVSVALHHLSRGNLRGARSLIERAEAHLAGVPSPFHGIHGRGLLLLADRCVRLGEEMIGARKSAGKHCLTKQEWFALPLPRLEIEPRRDQTASDDAPL
ncbi:MAG: DUF309 domain-containing protein [Thermogutta sp.]|nr:DUF309 domain-containing protein [Thermogutta sp.]